MRYTKSRKTNISTLLLAFLNFLASWEWQPYTSHIQLVLAWFSTTFFLPSSSEFDFCMYLKKPLICIPFPPGNLTDVFVYKFPQIPIYNIGNSTSSIHKNAQYIKHIYFQTILQLFKCKNLRKCW